MRSGLRWVESSCRLPLFREKSVFQEFKRSGKNKVAADSHLAHISLNSSIFEV